MTTEIHKAEPVTRWIVQSGEHAGHEIVRDLYGIRYQHADPQTAYWCMTCHAPVTVTEKRGKR